MPVVVVISQHLLNVFVQLANKRGLKKIVLVKYFVECSTEVLGARVIVKYFVRMFKLSALFE
jgi:hypothetical protein